MFRKLLCKLGNHIWVISQEKIHVSCMTDPATFKIQRCLCCNKKKKEMIP